MRHLFAVLAFLFIAHPALALKYKDILGTWTGTFTQKGSNGSGTLRIVMRISYFGRGGLSTVEKITNSSGNVFISQRHLNGQAGFAQVCTINGNVFFRGSGTWTAGTNAVRMQASLAFFNGAQVDEFTRFTVHKNRLSYYAKTNQGLITNGMLKRH